MPTRNRGKKSGDDKWFAERWFPIFKDAVDDLCYLFSRGYSENSALQIVGNRYKLNKRQRKAIWRISASEDDIKIRELSQCPVSDLVNKTLNIDGFNLLILLESALSGAYIFKCRDSTYRDISSVHGSYKRVLKTEEAILLTGTVLNSLKIKSTTWYLDKPVSNSGMLKSRLIEISQANSFNWNVALRFNPDKSLAKSKHVVISSDGWILNRAGQWFNLGAYIIENYISQANIIEV